MQKEAKQAPNSRQIAELLETTKAQLRQSQLEVQALKQEWLPPTDYRGLQDRLKEAQSSIKALKEEVQRKKDVIASLKSAKEQTESDA